MVLSLFFRGQVWLDCSGMKYEKTLLVLFLFLFFAMFLRYRFEHFCCFCLLWDLLLLMTAQMATSELQAWKGTAELDQLTT